MLAAKQRLPLCMLFVVYDMDRVLPASQLSMQSGSERRDHQHRSAGQCVACVLAVHAVWP